MKLATNRWNNMQILTPDEMEINRWLDLVDEEAVKVAAKWGIGNLEKMCGEDLAAKWRRHTEKLYAAIAAKDVAAVAELASGCVRAYAAMEKAALTAGHTPAAPVYWEVAHPESGRVYRIAPNRVMARAVSAPNVATYSLEEVARILEARTLDVIHAPTSGQGKPVAKIASRGTFEDDVPF